MSAPLSLPPRHARTPAGRPLPRLLLLVLLLAPLGQVVGAVEIEYEIIKEANGALLYGHYVADEHEFRIYDHTNNQYLMKYTNVEAAQLNIIGKKTVVVAKPVDPDAPVVGAVLKRAAGMTFPTLADRYPSRWQLSDALTLFHLECIQPRLPRSGVPDAIAVSIFTSNEAGKLHVVCYQADGEDAVIKLDEFEHDRALGEIDSGHLDGGFQVYTRGLDREVVRRQVVRPK